MLKQQRCPAGYKTVFVKDMAYYLVGRLDTIQYIPEGYVHTFLLRDPKKSVYSLYKMSLNKDLTGKAATLAQSIAYQSLIVISLSVERIQVACLWIIPRMICTPHRPGVWPH